MSLVGLKKRLVIIEQESHGHISETARREVESLLQIFVRQYNSPEAKAEREKKYKELQRISNLRKVSFESGESIDKYPLPWERR